MNWGYLGEYWNSIQEVGSTTVAWFQSLGNAVAGAIGNLFEFALRFVNDLRVLIEWILSIMLALIKFFLLPIIYAFNFLKSFTLAVFQPAVVPAGFENIGTSTWSIIVSMPYYSEIAGAIGIAFLAVIAVGTIKILMKLNA